MQHTFILSLLTLFSSILFGQQTILIENVTVIPLHINQVWEEKDVLIKNGKIASIGQSNDDDLFDDDIKTIDGTGKYLLPAFADAHAHLPKEEALEPYFLMNLMNGVTTLRSMKGEDWHWEIEEDFPMAPKIILTAPPISSRTTLSEFEIFELMDSYNEDGYDYVNIQGVKDKATFDHIVEASKEFGLELVGNCPSSVGISQVCRSGVYRSIEHLGGFFQLRDFDAIVKAMNLTVARNIYHCPTMEWYYTEQLDSDSLRSREGTKYIDSELIRRWDNKLVMYESDFEEEDELRAERRKKRKQFRSRKNLLGALYRQGGKLLVSPNASRPYVMPGYAMHQEMLHLANAGISNYDVLKAACYNLAEMEKETNYWGTIKVGASPDLVLLKKNPLRDIENTKSIEGIIFKGKYLSKRNLQRILEKQLEPEEEVEVEETPSTEEDDGNE